MKIYIYFNISYNYNSGLYKIYNVYILANCYYIVEKARDRDKLYSV